ncbi:MAG TPA: hypothetical protein VFU07_04015 [Candidatus Lumbricidophila sp.]|nr:hypothetical protein [Candidatus Lumbricidophila sp.]
MSGRYGAALMAALLGIYLVLIGSRAVAFIATGQPVAVVIGVSLLVLPAIGAWALWRELAFGVRAARLMRQLEADDEADLGIAPGESGTITRAAAHDAFGRFQSDTEAHPDRWQSWLRLGVVYDLAGDRRRARAAVRTALDLERGGRS